MLEFLSVILWCISVLFFFNDTENSFILILIAIDNMGVGTYMYGKKDGTKMVVRSCTLYVGSAAMNSLVSILSTED